MIKAKCTKIYRDKNNVIVAYDIVSNNNSKHIKKDELKALIEANKLSIDNLKLTNDGRLVSVGTMKDTNLRDKLMGAGNAGIVYQGLRYYISDGQVTVRAENKKIKAANILSRTEVIDTGAFRDCDNLEKAVMPQTVKVIKEGAFENCTKLKRINFPNSLTKLEKYAFSRCSGLDRVDIPAHLIKVSAQAFYDRSRDIAMKYWVLTPVQADKFSRRVKCIDVKKDNNVIVGYIIIDGTGNKKCIVPDDLKILMKTGKVDVTNLAVADDKIISKLETRNEASTARNTDSKQSRPVPKTLREKILASEGGVYTYKGLKYYLTPEGIAVSLGDPNEHKHNLGDVKILEGTEYIADTAFYDSKKGRMCPAKSIFIPSTVKQLQVEGLPSMLTNITVAEDNKMCASWDGALYDKSKTELVLYPPNKVGTCKIPEGVKVIQAHAFVEAKITSLEIPSSVDAVMDDAFLDCTQLETIRVSTNNKDYYSTPDGVLLTKDRRTLVCCPGGKKGRYKIPDGVQVIRYSAFSFCRWLTDIEIPKSVSRIEPYAFSDCSRLKNVLNYSSITELEAGTFESCHNLRNVTIPDGVMSIDYRAFGRCSNLKHITIPQSATDATLDAFLGCDNLVEITLPKHLEKVIFENIPKDVKSKIEDGELKLKFV